MGKAKIGTGKKLTAAQERMLLWRHTTGDFPGGANRGKSIAALTAAGYLEERDGRLSVTETGRSYCDQNHSRIRL